jgi:bifunctional DNA-binding transcriptional regulator/antitoxin component of YhaV-PrlF toxin-antitoxin module
MVLKSLNTDTTITHDMKLQKVFAYRYGDKVRYKYLITLPEDVVIKLGWKPGGELKEFIDGKNLILTYVSDPVENPKEEPKPMMSYEEFKAKIESELKANSNGLTWSELKERLKLPQTVPNNKWVRRLEKDIGLIRIKEARGLIWRLKS